MHDGSGAFSIAAIGLIGAVLVALISGVISMVGLIISKEQKLSDFRQAWIDALRDDISSFASHAILISAYCKIVMRAVFDKRAVDIRLAGEDQSRLEEIEKGFREATETYFKTTRENYSGINVCSTRIKLRLNDSPHEIESNDLLREMGRLEKVFSAGIDAIDDDVVQSIVAEIERISRPLLKKEWERVKKGERTFQVAKRTSIAISAFLALLVVVFFISVPAYFLGYISNAGSAPASAPAGREGGISIQMQATPSPCLPAPTVQNPAAK